MRLIDADSLKITMEKVLEWKISMNISTEQKKLLRLIFSWFMGVIDEAPAVDAVEVVRCWNCKHRQDYQLDGYIKELGVCICHDITRPHLVAPDHFCGYGERKDNG